MFIRDADAEDSLFLEQLEETAESPWSLQQITDEFNWNKGIRLVACSDDGTIGGWCCARLLPPEAELYKITVLPQQRRRGIGTLLMNTLIDKCREEGCSTMLLEVRGQNSEAILLYQSLGFIKEGLRKNYYSSPADHGVLMRRQII